MSVLDEREDGRNVNDGEKKRARERGESGQAK